MSEKRLKRCAGPKLKLFTCDLCGKEFSRNSFLQFHKLGHLDTMPFRCETCGKVFDRSFSYKKHLHTHNPLQKGKANRLKQHSVFHCWRCNDTFARRAELVKHTNIFHAHKFLCEFCGSQFLYRESLNIHHLNHYGMQVDAETGIETEKTKDEELPVMIHTGKVFRCKLCSKLFAVNSALENHVLVTHKLTKKQFTCKICRKNFSCQFSLSVHLRIHARFRPYICQLCHHTFARRDLLVKHKQNSHSTMTPFTGSTLYLHESQSKSSNPHP